MRFGLFQQKCIGDVSELILVEFKDCVKKEQSGQSFCQKMDKVDSPFASMEIYSMHSINLEILQIKYFQNCHATTIYCKCFAFP